MNESKMYIRIPTYIVRNEGIFLNNSEFFLYARLSLLHFRTYQQEELVVDHRKLMCNVQINDSRTLKKRLDTLHKHGLIRNKINKLPRKNGIMVIYNGDILKQCDSFTQINMNILKYINELDKDSFRLLFYYKSHINLDNREKEQNFCYVSYETLAERLKMGYSSISKANETLEDLGLIKIVRHQLHPTNEYGDDDELIYNRYNNHYYLNENLF